MRTRKGYRQAAAYVLNSTGKEYWYLAKILSWVFWMAIRCILVPRPSHSLVLISSSMQEIEGVVKAYSILLCDVNVYFGRQRGEGCRQQECSSPMWFSLTIPNKEWYFNSLAKRSSIQKISSYCYFTILFSNASWTAENPIWFNWTT